MNSPIRRSSAANPDLDWSQVRETVLMLTLAVTQIEKGMRDGDDSITMLADLFTGMMSNAEEILKAANALPDSLEKSLIIANFHDISTKMHKAIVAFQFYDKLAQRLTHVNLSLQSLGDLIAAPERLYNPTEWRNLQERIKSKYNIETDRRMFDAILAGASIEEALSLGESEFHLPDVEEEGIELF